MEWLTALSRFLPPDLGAQIENSLYTVVTALALLVVAALVFLAGWIVAVALARITMLVISGVGLDKPARRRAELRGVRAPLLPSRLVSSGVYWAVVLGVSVISLRVVGIDLVPPLAQRLMDLVPRLLLSGVILAAGLPLAFAAGRTLNAVLPPAGRRVERLRGQVASWLLAGLVSLLALDQLRLAAQLTLAVTVAGVAACALALALAFGLGCRDLARDLVVEYLRAGSETGEAARR